MHPVVRHMILCEDWIVASQESPRVTVIGLLSNIRSIDVPAYPLVYRELCIFLALTDGRGTGTGRIACTYEETGRTVFETADHPISFGADPWEVVPFGFRIRTCPFPGPGMYSVEFWHNYEKLQTCALRLR